MSGRIIAQMADERTSRKILEEVMRISAAVVDASTFDWKAYFEARATGEIFSTKFYKYETSTSPLGEKMNASVGLVAIPSTETEKNRDDFANRNAFSYVDCNFVYNENSKRIPVAIAGQAGFSYYGKKDVGIITPQTYWGIEDHDTYYIVHFSDKKHEELGLVSTPWCKDFDGNEMGYGIVSKYYAGMIDSILYSSSGLLSKTFLSHNSAHTELLKKGTGYTGSGSERTAYLLLMLWIKYATKNSQTIFKGCTSYNYQYLVAEVTENVDYLILSTTNAKNLVVGSAVSVGDPVDQTNYDRGQAYMRNIVERARIVKIEEISGTANSRVYLDTVFSTTATTRISTMPCCSGTTDNVLGADGYIANDGKYAYKLNGVEDGIGAYFISLNEIWNKESATIVSYYARKNAAWSGSSVQDYTKIATLDMVNTSDAWIGDISVDLETGVQYPRVYGSGDSVGVGDRQYKGGDGTGLKEALQRGNLTYGSAAGLSFAGLGGAPSVDWWSCAVCV